MLSEGVFILFRMSLAYARGGFPLAGSAGSTILMHNMFAHLEFWVFVIVGLLLAYTGYTSLMG